MSTEQRRYGTEAEKRRIVEAARGPETSVSVVARRFGVNANLVFKWLKDPRYGGRPDGKAFLPVEVASPPAKPDTGPADLTPLPPPSILEHRSGIIEIDLACGSRVRVDADVNDRTLTIAAEALQRSAALHAIETEARGQPPDRLAEIRQARSPSLFDDLEAWLKAQRPKISDKSPPAALIR